jgi:rod shape-determining protein MreC
MNSYINYDNKKSSLVIKHSLGLFFNKIETMFFIILCLIFLILNKINPVINKKISSLIIDVSAPVIATVSWPINTTISLFTSFNELIKAKEENILLKKQIQDLNSYYINSLSIYQENKELRTVLNFIKPKSQNYQIAEVIGFSQTYNNNSLVIDTVKNSKIKEGQIVVGNRGVVGRIESIDQDTGKATILLATDSRSKIPIMAAKSRNRGILTGLNSSSMEILYLPKNHRIEVKDKIFTSGDGDTLPSGLLIGVVDKVEKNSVTVTPVENIANLNTVTIVYY